MTKKTRCLLVLVIVVLACGTGWAANTETDAPWGYLYAVRTLRLYPLTADENHVGRLTENQIVLTSPRVSRRHAVIRRTERGAELVDVGSSNGSRHNEEAMRARIPVPLVPGDRIQLADELLLFHSSVEGLWRDELELRLSTNILKLRLHLPQDEIRKSFGREVVVPALTEARIFTQDGKVEVEHSVQVDPHRGFPADSAAFVGRVFVDEETLELSLWSIAAGESMTSRRSSLSNLKHTVLRISLPDVGPEEAVGAAASRPWFASHHLASLFEVFPAEPELSLQFAHGLALQERPVALRDAAEAFSMRHRLDPDGGKHLAMAARCKARWVEMEVSENRMRLKARAKRLLSEAVDEAKIWLARAGELGASADESAAAEEAIRRATSQLARLEG